MLLVAAYFNDAFNDSEMATFKKKVKDIMSQYPADMFMLMGDFNARIADMGQIEPDLFLGGEITHGRKSQDMKDNSRGIDLHNFLEVEGFIVLNGRTKSDPKGQLTYISQSISIDEKQCGSVIDLVYVDMAQIYKIEDLEVAEILGSDHFPVITTIGIQCDRQNRIRQWRYYWKEEEKEKYQQFIEQKLEMEGDQGANKLTDIIIEAAETLKLKSYGVPPGKTLGLTRNANE